MINLDQNEKILLTVRKHWIVYFSEGILILLMVLAPIILLQFSDILNSFVKFTGNGFLVFIFLASLWLLFCWTLFFVLWTNNYLDMLIVTDRRVIDIEQLTLFHRESSSLYLDKIEDMTIESHGILASTFGYGNIHIQTAGENREIRLNTIGDPEDVRKIISEAQHQKAS